MGGHPNTRHTKPAETPPHRVCRAQRTGYPPRHKELSPTGCVTGGVMRITRLRWLADPTGGSPPTTQPRQAGCHDAGAFPPPVRARSVTGVALSEWLWRAALTIRARQTPRPLTCAPPRTRACAPRRVCHEAPHPSQVRAVFCELRAAAVAHWAISTSSLAHLASSHHMRASLKDGYR